MEPKSRYLIVANQTAAGPALQNAVRELLAHGPCEFRLVVPATHPRDQAAWAEGTAHGIARRRLMEALEILRATGAEVEGWVGAANPYHAIADALVDSDYDQIVLSTFPPGISRWLHMDVATRIRDNYGIPVKVVYGARDRVAVGH